MSKIGKVKVLTLTAALAITIVPVAHSQPAPAPRVATPPVVKAQSNPEPLVVTLVRQKVVTVDGKEVLQSAEVAKPGDVLDEVATYSNKSTSPVKNLQATLPVPPNTDLILASIKPQGARASIDGNQFSPLPLKRKVRQANGVETEQPVPIAEYRYLRWFPGELAPGKSLVFSARFKVSSGDAQVLASPGK